MEHDLDKSVEEKFGKKPKFFENNQNHNIKNIIGVFSGKGGVGKSMVTTLLAVELQKKGYNVGILDADITGPSIPKSFGLEPNVSGNDTDMFPPVSKSGIKIMSINLLMDDETQPVLWRGPMLGSVLRQFYSNTLWGELDYLLIDMPPGTGDVSMTVFQSMPLTGVIIVSTPQDLVKMIVAKAINMCKQMDVEILGLVENMSYMECDKCGNYIYPFGESKLNDIALTYEINPLGRLPIVPNNSKLIDNGKAEDIDSSIIDEVIDNLLN